MSTTSRKSILREIAQLSNPTPRDYDPEDIAPDFEPSDSDQENDNDAGREHYVDVGYAKFGRPVDPVR